MSDEMNKPKPCPFCGSTEIYCEDESFLTCDNCGATMPKMLWNTRPTEDTLTAHVECAENELVECHERAGKTKVMVERLIEAGDEMGRDAIDWWDGDAANSWDALAAKWKAAQND